MGRLRTAAMPHRFLPDVALADVAFEASSASLSGLFEESAKALMEVMVDPASMSPHTKRTLNVSSEDLDRLLYDFLTELIVLKDTDSLLFRDFKVSIDVPKNTLRCSLLGEPIDRVHHRLRNDVKAVTMHLFGIERSGKIWKAKVVLDI
jgi:SHS2 domain-containing protein